MSFCACILSLALRLSTLEMESVTRVQTAKTFEVSMNVFSRAIGIYYGSMFFFFLNFDKATSTGEGKFFIQSNFNPLKNWPGITSCPW